MTDDEKKLGLTFPCDFPIKIFGAATAHFEKTILEIIQQQIAEGMEEDAVSRRPSKDGKYLALTVIVHVESQQQLDKIYHALTACPDVLMAL
jgi:putative lipoic acid-binding regulatory protein